MRVLMIAGVAGKAEAGVAGIVYNLTQQLRKLGHTVTPLFFDDLLPKTRWPRRFRTFEFAAAIAQYVSRVKNDFDVINVHAPFGFLYGFQRRRRGLHGRTVYGNIFTTCVRTGGRSGPQTNALLQIVKLFYFYSCTISSRPTEYGSFPMASGRNFFITAPQVKIPYRGFYLSALGSIIKVSIL